MMKVGEAANRLSRLGVLEPDGVEWALAVANRNLLIHRDDEIDCRLAWLTLSRDLLACGESLQALLASALAAMHDSTGQGSERGLRHGVPQGWETGETR